jgi:hypothetical protein
MAYWNYDINYHFEKFKSKFPDQQSIPITPSQAWQDLFVLTMLDGKKNGSYVEIGANHPCYGSNTFALNEYFNFNGLSIDIEDFSSLWQAQRPLCNFVCADATTINYKELFDKLNISTQTDYLQIDVDPPEVSLQVLKQLPLDTHRFSVITFETDVWQGDTSVAEESRQLLKSYGYQLVVKNVACCNKDADGKLIWYPFEDWWVDPLVISADKIEKFTHLNESEVYPQQIFLDIDKSQFIDYVRGD